jgi:DNA primase
MNKGLARCTGEVAARVIAPAYGFLFSDRVQAMSGVDYAAVRSAVSMQQVLDLLGYVPALWQGDQVRGPCPIHHSKSAESRSFSADLERNAFRCFSCGAQGNQLDLWCQTQSLPLFEAALDLCRRLEVPVPRSERGNPK